MQIHTTTRTIETHDTREIIDITDHVARSIAAQGAGHCSLFVTHTTAALTTANLDPGTDLDMLDAFNELIPALNYRHPHDPAHAPDHILATLIGPSVTIPIRDGSLMLGTWQRVVLIECDGPRTRTLHVTTVMTEKDDLD